MRHLRTVCPPMLDGQVRVIDLFSQSNGNVLKVESLRERFEESFQSDPKAFAT